jgi:predicted TIM-barrel fold metal-dependent hydrolase
MLGASPNPGDETVATPLRILATERLNVHPKDPADKQTGVLDRRTLLAAGAAAAMTPAGDLLAQTRPVPIIDTHIHLFDPNRPQGAPYKGPNGSETNKTGAFPKRYMELMAPLGSLGAIVVEASPWIEDNFWVLEQCADETSMLGLIGNLQPDAPDFAVYLDRLHKNPLFLGIRYGNLFGYSLPAKVVTPGFKDGLKRLADAGLTLDTANPNVALLEAVVRASDAAPALRIVVDHLPNFTPTAAETPAYEAALRELKARPNIYTKISEVIHPIDGVTSTNIDSYRARVDHIYETFGEDRVLFGSDWPNSDGVAPVDKVVAIMRAYFAGKTPQQAEKYFWRNSIAAYRWKPRSAAQKALVA